MWQLVVSTAAGVVVGWMARSLWYGFDNPILKMDPKDLRHAADVAEWRLKVLAGEPNRFTDVE